jgi:chromosome segregation ATPase
MMEAEHRMTDEQLWALSCAGKLGVAAYKEIRALAAERDRLYQEVVVFRMALERLASTEGFEARGKYAESVVERDRLVAERDRLAADRLWLEAERSWFKKVVADQLAERNRLIAQRDRYLEGWRRAADKIEAQCSERDRLRAERNRLVAQVEALEAKVDTWAAREAKRYHPASSADSGAET